LIPASRGSTSPLRPPDAVLSNILAVSGKWAVDRLAEKHRGRRVSVARHPHPDEFHPTRRQFVLSAAALAGCGQRVPARADEPKKRPRVAAIYTVFQKRSHAHVHLFPGLTIIYHP